MQRRLLAVLTLSGTVFASAACSHTVEGRGSFGAAGSGKRLSDRSATQILRAASMAAGAATSVHITGTDYEDGTKYTVDLNIGGDKTCKGTVAIGNEGPTDLIIVRGHLYYSVDSGKHYRRGSDKVTASKQAILMCSRKALRAIVSPGSSVRKKGTGTVDGQRAVTVTDADAEVTIRDDAGAPYLLEFATPKQDKTDLHFSDWNEPVTVRKPKTSD